jgi:hypothetical protein
MDDVIDFSNLSLEAPVASETPAAASSGTSVSLFSTPLLTGSGSTGGGSVWFECWLVLVS